MARPYDMLGLGDAQANLGGGTKAVLRPPPLFFHIDARVSDSQREHEIRFKAQAQVRYAAQFIISLRDAVAFRSLAITADQNIIVESFRAGSAIFRAGFEEIGHRLYQGSLPQELFIEGTAVLLSVQPSNNYFHWLLEALPRLFLLQRQGMLPDDCTIIAPLMQPFMREVLRRSGFGHLKVLELPDDLAARCERLLVPARGISDIRTFCPHSVAFTSSLRSPSQEGEGLRLYISRSRSSSRRIGNEDEIMPIIRAYGFEVVYPEELSFPEQVQLFQKAMHVAGPLGAGLTNAVLARPGATLIEFAPEGRTGDATLFANMAHCWGMNYAGLVGSFSGNWHRPDDRKDFHVDPQQVAAAFAAAVPSH